MNTVLLGIVGVFFGFVLLAAISPFLSAISMLLMIFGLLTGNGGLAFLGLIGCMIFGALAMFVESAPVYVVNKR